MSQESGVRSQKSEATHGLAHVKFLKATRSRLSVAAVAEEPGAEAACRADVQLRLDAVGEERLILNS